MHGTGDISNGNQYADGAGTYGVVNATRQVRKQKTRQESAAATAAEANYSDQTSRQRIFLLLLLLCLSRMMLIKLAESN